MKDSLNIDDVDYEKWKHLPRRFTRCSARFELPIDIKELAKLKPFKYLSRFVFVNSDKKQLYHRIFIKYLPRNQLNKEETENEEFLASIGGKQNFAENLLAARVMQPDQLSEALTEVLGFHATVENVNEIVSFLELDTLDDDESINFRTFCGIVSFAERLITTLDQDEDPRDEIEIADFETLLARHYDKIESEMMRKMLDVIQR
jgi:hypothetical protein